MPTDRYDLSILADCPGLLAELGWVPNSDDPDAEYTKADKHGMVYRTLSEATASDRREAIGLLVERLGENGVYIKPDPEYRKIVYWRVKGIAYSKGQTNINPGIRHAHDPLHALHAAYVATKGQ